MSALTVTYRCCPRRFPLYLKHREVENVAWHVRQQLVSPQAEAIGLSRLKEIDHLTINTVAFELWIDTEHPVSDEEGRPVMGVCEFDPAATLEAAAISVSPIDDEITEELVLSTLAHELGHAIFDAPAWITTANQGLEWFDAPEGASLKAYRTTTRNAEHLQHSQELPQPDEPADTPVMGLEQHIYFAELRANEFMGSLLVPRQCLRQAIETCAPTCGVTLEREPSLLSHSSGFPFTIRRDHKPANLDQLQRLLAKRFGVHRRFIEVRMERYGLFSSPLTHH